MYAYTIEDQIPWKSLTAGGSEASVVSFAFAEVSRIATCPSNRTPEVVALMADPGRARTKLVQGRRDTRRASVQPESVEAHACAQS